MAHRIIGIDVGPLAVRAVELALTFREAKVTWSAERPLPPGPEPAEERTRAALVALATERHWAGEQLMVAAEDEHVAARIVQFPFSDASKIDKALPFQLEGAVPFPLESMVRDHRVLEKNGPHGTRVLVAMAERTSVARTLELFHSAGLEPRAVLFGPAALAAAARRAGGDGASAAANGHDAVAVVEIGASRSAVAVVAGGKLRFVRILLRGLRHVHHEVADTLGCTEEEAEAVVRNHGEAQAPGAAARGGDRGRLDVALRRALGPLGVEVKRTLLADRGASPGAEPPARIVVCGEGAALRGVAAWLEGATGLPARPLEVEGVAPPLARAFGLALSGGPGAVAVPDLRRGDLAFKAAASFVRDRVLRLVAFAAGLAILWGGSVWARLAVFDAEEKALTARLASVTKNITGHEITDFDVAAKEILGAGAAGENPMPDATAYDVLRELSGRIPKDVVVDVKELDIKPKKTFIKGEIDKAGDEDRIVAALKDWTACFTEFKPGEVRPTIDKKRKEFSLTITSNCP
jgi:Tfp pilus assembly PilM family ATPase